MVRLVAASLQPPLGLVEFLRELGDGEDGFVGEQDFVAGRLTLEGLLQRLMDVSEGRNLPDGWVPMTTFWLLEDTGAIVGLSRLRHRLNDFLHRHGGHIGYYIRASERGKGYGTRVLALTLPYARALGLDRVLLTVDSDNERSIHVIERNGGVVEEECIDETTGRLHRRYWIDLK